MQRTDPILYIFPSLPKTKNKKPITYSLPNYYQSRYFKSKQKLNTENLSFFLLKAVADTCPMKAKLMALQNIASTHSGRGQAQHSLTRFKMTHQVEKRNFYYVANILEESKQNQSGCVHQDRLDSSAAFIQKVCQS